MIERFLSAQPLGAIGLDAGCGNGKNLPRPSAPSSDSTTTTASTSPTYTLASDRSAALLQHTSPQPTSSAPSPPPHPFDALLADARALPHPPNRFDFALSAAVIHHMSTRSRRVDALREMVRALRRPGGRGLVTVWALEQRGSRRGWGEGDGQDVMVPWVLQARREVAPGRRKKKARGADVDVQEGGGCKEEEQEGDTARQPQTFQRFYHLYREGELEEDVRSAGGRVELAGYEKDNWWVVFSADGAAAQPPSVAAQQKPP